MIVAKSMYLLLLLRLEFTALETEPCRGTDDIEVDKQRSERGDFDMSAAVWGWGWGCGWGWDQ